MNTTKSALLAILVFSFCLPVLADSETRDIEGFDAIAVGGGIELHVQQGDTFHVEVVSPTDDADDVITEIRDNTLTIRRDRSFFSSLNWFGFVVRDSVNVTLPVLTSLSASGGSNVRGESVFSVDDLEISTSGGSDLSIEVEADTLEISTSGGSDMTVAGSTNRVRVQTSGGSDLHAADLEAKDADLTSSGGSDISITVLERLTARASGGSDIQYSGNPDYTDINDSGGADVRRR
jgi:hypothetical protein